MKLLGLPGRLESTHVQMVDLVNTVRLGQSRTSVQTYGFWTGGDSSDPNIAPEAEIAALSGADVVFAKSIGTLVAMLAADRHGFSPEKCVFLGTPLRRMKAKGELELLRSYCRRTPTLFIQQTDDATGGWAELAAFVAPWSSCVELAGDDHLYADAAGLAAVIEAWVA